MVNAANGAGLERALASIVKAPAWARPGNTDLSVEGPPADPTPMPTSWAQLAGHYCGKVKAIEVWNEQNLWYEWGNEPLNAGRLRGLLAAPTARSRPPARSTVVISGAPDAYRRQRRLGHR